MADPANFSDACAGLDPLQNLPLIQFTLGGGFVGGSVRSSFV